VGVCLSAVQWHVAPEQARPFGVGLSFVLAWASAVDLDRRLLPDPLTLGLCVAGLWLGWREGWEQALESAIGAAAGYGALALVGLGYKRIRGREGLGLGDAKLLAAAGAWCGWQDLPLVLLMGSLLALLWVAVSGILGARWTRESALPFGPFIATGFWGVWVFDPVAQFYVQGA
jgi:leader peptidase (prepilin peptidase) / N-methyltransferase